MDSAGLMQLYGVILYSALFIIPAAIFLLWLYRKDRKYLGTRCQPPSEAREAVAHNVVSLEEWRNAHADVNRSKPF